MLLEIKFPYLAYDSWTKSVSSKMFCTYLTLTPISKMLIIFYPNFQFLPVISCIILLAIQQGFY